MMFNPDRPIESFHEDLLNRANLAKSIGEAILKSQTKDSLVIGLLGKWGSGKTSLVNMIEEHIMKISTEVEPEKRPIIVYFNPWNFSDQNQLVYQFFNHLSIVIGREDSSVALKKVGSLLKTVGKISSVGKYFPFVSQASSVSSDVCNTVGEATENFAQMLEKDLSGIRTEISNILKEQDNKIIIIIDDIDRLNDKEIRQIFQLVKSLADFPNTVYLLTFDKKVVADALEKDQPGHGTEYLEKIIQVPLDIPLISKSELERLLTIQLDKLLENIPESEFDRVYWGNVYQSGFKHFFENIRDVTRYINVLRFNYELVKDEVNPIDFIAITAVQVFIPEVYRKISENKEVFTRIATTSDRNKQEHKQICDEIIGSADSKFQKFLLGYLEILFPNLNTIYGAIFYDRSFERSWRVDRRICSEDVFDVYFKFSISDGEISQREIKSIIYSGNDSEKFSEKLLELIKNGKILRFLAIFPDHAREIQESNIVNIISSVLDIGDLFPSDNTILYGTPLRIHIITNSLIKRFSTENERFTILKNSIENSTRSLYSLAWEVDYLDESHGRYHYKKSETHEENLIVSADHLDALEDLVCTKIKVWAENGKLESHKKIIPILQVWKQWGANETEINNVINKVIKDDHNLINFVSNFISPVYSHTINDYVGTTTWRINFGLMKEFINLSEIEDRLNEIDPLNKFENMTDMEKIAVKLFFENIEAYKLDTSQKILPLID
ncbi:Phage T7 exclusion protein [Methanosarcina barkeri 227]|uniref:Phage T7 exclusion protein n=2 Tax=Methanosarcina barkeri TaxID=2208 RepID=A0A0E3R2J0_METBA|nr:Phage T7 exclusion protein [Methanosarcina barkeri 227]